ncbi:nitrite reductase large subunit NirB [Paenarthrobacter sp. DKR-5]|uniref:nitrite reductase large subunit NirB n=1 Tax=Paenarthrobacter sp. DKR-5 TaxID=2835535 RepID=UPI001BDDA204|nr:nitrite reductase large subunit NirB [Paenarthrobacter sp. DKR-5]MBT1002500.1 nitrite reductase large subunit NirB [Paenarthrobacter sp. DKR-5]
MAIHPVSSPPPEGTRRIVVVGGGPAAHRFVDALGARDGAGSFEITVLSEEEWFPYDRVALSSALAGEKDLTLGAPGFWDRPGVLLRSGQRVTAVDPGGRRVRTAAGETVPYDELVLATGSDAARPPVPGADLCRVYRTLDDVRQLAADVPRLAAELGRRPRAVVVGGGLLGLEAAGGLQKLGADSAVVHSGKWLMSAQLDEGAGQALGRLIEAQDITLHLGVRPSAFHFDGPSDGPSGGKGTGARATGVDLTDGSRLDADLVVLAIGITARDELARDTGLAVGPRGGVVIDAGCATSAPHIWAIGEVANFDGQCVGLVAPANTMAEVCVDRLLGGSATFPGFDTATKLKLSGVDVASFGDAFGATEHCLEIVYADPARGLYQKIVTTRDARTLLGGIFVGDAGPYTTLRPFLGRELAAEPGAYLSAAGGEAPETDLPDDAILCSCNNVAVGGIRDTIHAAGSCEGEAPVQDLAALKDCTRAGTQCGSCVPMLKKLLETELTRSGIAVSKALCEHFPMSRPELFEAVRVLELSSFEDILARFGTGEVATAGRGCDICKPVVASILASQRNEYVLDAGRGALQDTNDRALANMQKNGTYSVVPRIPGGEITPEKLAVIAAVAQKYSLYTKITGGQRIDLFGARLEQLPEIWKELVDAGMESGQAYGKSLRTVKSCVGSTWCRYGVQDSVGMAVQLELRYRGLRSPHKLKVGVSGCARECAEARGKDVGVIATADGWNLYVGGNGGATPAHAQLLAKDLDDETLVRYIDRYFMYYIRTADRLQRTARWQEELDGGLDHVRDVIVNDSLGIAADLEAAMARHVDSYEDEWAATLKDPERLRRFRSFVNAPDEADPTIVSVLERGQPRPATAEESAAGPVHLSGPVIPVRKA